MHPDIEQAMITGDKRPWLAAVIVPSEDISALPKADQQKRLKAACDGINANLSQLKKFAASLLLMMHLPLKMVK